jgi:ElaB/YqjD/DUF883 family membrane-anchored ribosome-binding protein
MVKNARSAFNPLTAQPPGHQVRLFNRSTSMTTKKATSGTHTAEETWREQVAEQATAAKDRASSMARTAAERLDEGRSTAADRLDDAASAVQGRADDLPGGRAREFAYAAAEQLNTTADYVRSHDINRMKTDVETLVKNNPGPSLLAAAAVGFLLGRALARE